MKWLAATATAAFGVWIKSIADRSYVRGYTDALENYEKQTRELERQMKRAVR